jgi:hypothetical protein
MTRKCLRIYGFRIISMKKIISQSKSNKDKHLNHNLGFDV